MQRTDSFSHQLNLGCSFCLIFFMTVSAFPQLLVLVVVHLRGCCRQAEFLAATTTGEDRCASRPSLTANAIRRTKSGPAELPCAAHPRDHWEEWLES